MTTRPATYEAYRQALRSLVNEAWPFFGLTQVYQSKVYEPATQSFEHETIVVKKGRRAVSFGEDSAVVGPYQDAWDYFQAERLLTADTTWCNTFARKLNKLAPSPVAAPLPLFGDDGPARG